MRDLTELERALELSRRARTGGVTVQALDGRITLTRNQDDYTILVQVTDDRAGESAAVVLEAHAANALWGALY